VFKKLNKIYPQLKKRYRSLNIYKISESIRGEKEAIEKSLIFAYGSDKINGVKEEVLECSLVTTS
jgi:hypothetical protein